MKRLIFCLLFLTFLLKGAFAQVEEMNWKLDYQIFLKLANDSNYTYDIRDAFHVSNTKQGFSSNFIFYPANPGKDFINEIPDYQNENARYVTLWSALHAKIGGGWVHFANCIAYAMETKNLDLTSPLMKRPETKWKPKPVTESYKRTKKWGYYVPYSQKNARKEYQKRIKSGDVVDIESLPGSYIELFLNTNQKEYDKLREERNYNKLAKIDLVKVVLGANYLSDVQINYMSNAILEAVTNYSYNMLPSVIIFDDFDAAATMSLNAEGYKVEDVVFKASANLSDEEIAIRKEEINKIVHKINDYNQNSFKKSLGSYYSR